MKNKYNANTWVCTISLNASGKARWLKGCFSPFTGSKYMYVVHEPVQV